jgi:hypothetical protein
VAEIDAELAKQGLPRIREIFQIDYEGDEPIAEAEVVTPEAERG